MASNGPGQGIDKKRTITIDPSMYSISKKTKRNAQTSNKNAAKIKPRPFIRPNSLKRELIAKIKLHQQQKQQKQEQQPHQEKQEHQQHQSRTYNDRASEPDKHKLGLWSGQQWRFDSFRGARRRLHRCYVFHPIETSS